MQKSMFLHVFMIKDDQGYDKFFLAKQLEFCITSTSVLTLPLTCP